MGKLTEFAILFDNNREVFYPGQNVSGCVVMTLSSPMEMRGIKLIAQGKGECRWSETTGTGDNRHTNHYRGSENLFEFQLWVHGNSAKFTNEAGRFFFPFDFILPPVLPSSFEGFHGHIRYQIFAEIDKPWKFNHKTTRAFTINEVIDTNFPNYNSLLSGSTHKDVGCFCCAAGPLDLTASIDRKAYCPGELILITAEAQNSTTRNMAGMKAQLYKHIEYIAKGKRKHCSEKIAIIHGGFMGYPQMSQPLYAPMVGATAINISDKNDAHIFGNLNYIPVYAFNNMQQAQINSLPVANPISSVVDQQPVLLSQPPPMNYGPTN
ncbi:arrestin domain-containing protein 3 isoform X3 [Hydra vulgaris]|uniref:arrestin domain-containing protein 3 isoform X3 n=1 Tax=Hydra vulgaris TaxID=6087 RepID=UPI0032EA5C6F